MREGTVDGRVQVVEMKAASDAEEETRVLRVMREPLHMDPPVVRFAAPAKRYLGFFH